VTVWAEMVWVRVSTASAKASKGPHRRTIVSRLEHEKFCERKDASMKLGLAQGKETLPKH
jgi:hypothetical protein